MKLSIKQVQVTKALIAFQKQGRKQVSLKEIAAHVYVTQGADRPVNWRTAMSMTMRVFIDKLDLKKIGPVINRTSKLGRGAEAIYNFDGDFTGLLNRSSKASKVPK